VRDSAEWFRLKPAAMTKEETDFIHYWEANRLKRKKIFRQLLVGIPAGLLITVPIVVNLVSGWYKRATMEVNSSDFNPLVLIVALLIIVAFSAIFWQQHQWDQFEQRYLELLVKRDREEVADDPGATGNGVGRDDKGGVERDGAHDEGDAMVKQQPRGAKKSPGDHQGS
jgi:hypothetical protein